MSDDPRVRADQAVERASERAEEPLGQGSPSPAVDRERTHRTRFAPAAVVAVCMAIAGAVVCGGVAIHEWNYHENHPFRTGVSGVLTVLAIGGVLGCLAVAVLAWAVGRRG
jgi:hypothetical protein